VKPKGEQKMRLGEREEERKNEIKIDTEGGYCFLGTKEGSSHADFISTSTPIQMRKKKSNAL
jgi:hypothetical protein